MRRTVNIPMEHVSEGNQLISFLKGSAVIIVIGLLGLGLLVFGLWQLFPTADTSVTIEKSSEESSSESPSKERIMVDVAGAVEKPGVYELKSGDRIKDGVLAAGGVRVD